MNTEYLNYFDFLQVDGGYSLIKYKEKGENVEKVVIPTEFQGELVVEIAAFAFHECYALVELILPSSLKNVQKKAIYHCMSLKKVSCLSKHVDFHKESFRVCFALEEIPFSVWEQLCLDNLTNEKILKHYQAQWNSISTHEKNKITTLISGNHYIKEYLFTEGDTVLSSFLLGEGVILTLDELKDYLQESIDRRDTIATAILLAYQERNYSKKQLEDYQIHKELLNLGFESPTPEEFHRRWRSKVVEGGLEVCSFKGSETEIWLPSKLSDGTNIFGTSVQVNGVYNPLQKLNVEDGIRYLDKQTFLRTDSLQEITLPESLETIGEGCFSLCKCLKSIRIPEKVKYLPLNCFKNSPYLEVVELPEGLLSVGDYAFSQCKSLKNVRLPESLMELEQGSAPNINLLGTTIYCGLFSGSGLEVITIPKGVAKIPKYAFYSCDSLKEVHLHDSITDVGSAAFKFARLLADEDGFVIVKEILFDYVDGKGTCVVPDSVKKISSLAFLRSEIEEICLPEGLEEIESGAFMNCGKLKKIIIPSSVKVLPKNTFEECQMLEEVVVSTCTTVEEGFFKNCPTGKIVKKENKE